MIKKFINRFEQSIARIIIALRILSIIYSILIILLCMIFFAFFMRIPQIKSLVSLLLSFTTNSDYKVAYIEFFGAIIGSLIAVYGALWVQREIENIHEKKKSKKYACIVFYDLEYAINDLQKIFSKAKINSISDENAADKFYKEAFNTKIHLSQTWISDVAQLTEVLSDIEIKIIYNFYGKYADINNALEHQTPDCIKKIYIDKIAWFFHDGKTGVEINSDYYNILEKLNKIKT